MNFNKLERVFTENPELVGVLMVVVFLLPAIAENILHFFNL